MYLVLIILYVFDLFSVDNKVSQFKYRRANKLKSLQ